MKTLIVGLLILLVALLWRVHYLGILSFRGSITTVVKEEKVILPTKIKIASLGVELPVEETKINGSVWQIPAKAAGHLNVSAGIGGGNMVVYAHNKQSLFGPIRWIKPEAEVVISGNDGQNYNYKVVETFEVYSTQIEYILPKEENILTLYTCSGFLDSKRFIVLAKPLLTKK